MSMLLILHNFPLSLEKILGASIEEKKVIACKGIRITSPADLSSANPDGRGQWNKSSNTERKINFSL